MMLANLSKARREGSCMVRKVVWVALSLAVLSAGCKERWDTTQQPVKDEELDTAFFAGLDDKEIADVPEPTGLRPCCILGNDVGAEVGSVPVPGYEIRYTLDLETLGTHQFNKGTLTVTPRGEKGVLSDEVSGILYTCRGGFVDIAHVRDNADRTLFLASHIARMAATGGTIPITGEGATRRIVVKPLDPRLVRTTASGRWSSGWPSGSITRRESGTRSPRGTAGRPRRSPSGRPHSRRRISTPTSWG